MNSGRLELFRANVNELWCRRRDNGTLSPAEQELWQTALATPYGGIVIGRDNDPYLVRAYLMPERSQSTELPGVYLHYFVRGDSDLNPHNHPWVDAETQILTGGYMEYRLNADMCTFKTKRMEAGMRSSLTHETFHRVELLNPERGCWTLFTVGRRLHPSDGTDWGFYDVEKHQYFPWGDYK